MTSGHCKTEGMTEEPDDLRDAHRSSTNAATLTLITIVFGVVWLADRGAIPTWLISMWFVLIIPLNLFLMFMYRRRYHAMRLLYEDSTDSRDSGS